MYWAAWCLGILGVFFMPDDGLIVGLLVLILALISWRCRQHTLYLVWLLAAVYAFWRVDMALQQQVPLQITTQTAQVTVNQVPIIHDNAQRFAATITLDTGQTFDVLAYDGHNNPWAVGQMARCSVRLRPFIGMVNAYGFDVEAWALAQGLDGSAYIVSACQSHQTSAVWFWQSWREKAWLRLQNLHTSHQQGKAMVAALTIGIQDALSDDTWQAMRQLGIVHLVSISGVHVTMLAALVAFVAGKILRYWPYSVRTPMLWQCWTGVAVASVYALVAGFHIPTQRTVWMLWVFAMVLTCRYRRSWFEIWLMALSIVVTIEPSAFLSVGLWLSFGLVGVMIWVSHINQNASRWRLMWQMQWAMMLFTWVLVGKFFHVVPLLSPVANAVAIPFFSWVLTPLALAAMVLPWDGLLLCVVALAQYSIDASVWAANWAPVAVVAAQSTVVWLLAMLAAALLLLPAVANWRCVAALVAVFWMVYRPPLLSEGQLQVQVLDVGQGLSVLLTTRNHVLLFDTGKNTAHSVVLPMLYAQGHKKIDDLVLSHTDDDHDGAASAVLANMTASRIWSSTPLAYPHWQVQQCRDAAWQWDGVWFEWLTLPEELAANTPNARSCVLRVVTAKQAVLIPADIGHKEERYLVAQYGQSLHSTVLVLGHHGSSGSNSSEFLNTVAPRVAIASSAWQNAYRHPTQVVQTRLQAHQIALYRTDHQGAGQWILDENLDFQPLTGRRYWWHRKPLSVQKDAV